MNEPEKKVKNAEKPQQKLLEGVHYYFENQFMVFTRRYHLERGYCCGNGCRECPYKSNTMKDKASS